MNIENALYSLYIKNILKNFCRKERNREQLQEMEGQESFFLFNKMGEITTCLYALEIYSMKMGNDDAGERVENYWTKQ